MGLRDLWRKVNRGEALKALEKQKLPLKVKEDAKQKIIERTKE